MKRDSTPAINDAQLRAEYGSAMIDQAEFLSALKSMSRDMPCPRDTAFYAPGVIVKALLSAVTSQYGLSLPSCTPAVLVHEMRARGLVGYDGSHLTAFACAVRRELRKDDA